MDAILTVTDKFTKFVRLIPGKTTYDARDWAIAYYDYVYSQFSLPGTIISDRDSKFTSLFWRELFKRTNTRLALTTAYHPQADGQSERTNQTVEVALRCFLSEGTKGLSEWDELLPEVEYALNTSVNATTGYTPFFLLYGVHPRSEINSASASCNDAEQFFQDRRQIREDAYEAIRLAQARMAIYYNEKHRPINIKDKVWLKLAKGTEIGYRLPNSTSLDVIKTGPFTVKRQIKKLTYELDLPKDMKMHPFFSVIHLEAAEDDPYDRSNPPPAPVIMDGEQTHLVDRILRKEKRRERGDPTRKWYYRVRWQGYGPKDDTWQEEEQLRNDVPEIVEAFERHREGVLARKKRRRS